MSYGFMLPGGSGLPDRNVVGKNDCVGMNSSYPNVALSVGSNLQVTAALDGNTYIAMQPPRGEYKGESYVGALRSDVVSALMAGASVSEVISAGLNGDNVSVSRSITVEKDCIYVAMLSAHTTTTSISLPLVQLWSVAGTGYRNYDCDASRSYAYRYVVAKATATQSITVAATIGDQYGSGYFRVVKIKI